MKVSPFAEKLAEPVNVPRLVTAYYTKVRRWSAWDCSTGTTSFFESFRPLVERSRHCEIVICPSFLDMEAAVMVTRGTRIQIGAQNLY